MFLFEGQLRPLWHGDILMGGAEKSRPEQFRTIPKTNWPGERSGKESFQFFWDDKTAGNVRVLGSIDDGGIRGIRALLPATDSFMLTKPGKQICRRMKKQVANPAAANPAGASRLQSLDAVRRVA